MKNTQTIDAPRFLSGAQLREVAKAKDYWHKQLKLLRRAMSREVRNGNN